MRVNSSRGLMMKLIKYVVMWLFIFGTLNIKASNTVIQTDTLMIPYQYLNQLSVSYLEERSLVHVTSNQDVKIIYNEADINRIKSTNKTGNQFIKVYVLIGNDRIITSVRVLVHEGIEMKSGSYPVTLYFKDQQVNFEEKIRLILISSKAVFNEDYTHVLDAYDVYLTPKQVDEIRATNNMEAIILELSWARVFAIEDNNETRELEIQMNQDIQDLGTYPVKIKVIVDGVSLEKIVYIHVIEELAMISENWSQNDYYFENNNQVSRAYWTEQLITYALFVAVLIIPLVIVHKQANKTKDLFESSKDAIEK